MTLCLTCHTPGCDSKCQPRCCADCGRCYSYPRDKACPGCDSRCFYTPDSPTKTKPQPHKHAAVIKAWADGAQIEWRACAKDEWHQLPVASNSDNRMIVWRPDYEYRVQPAAPDYGQIARDTYNESCTNGDGRVSARLPWIKAAAAVINAYKEQNKLS